MTLCNSVKERLFSHYALFHTQLINVFHYLQTLPLVTLLHFMSCHSIQIGCFLNVFFLIFHFYSNILGDSPASSHHCKAMMSLCHMLFPQLPSRLRDVSCTHCMQEKTILSRHVTSHPSTAVNITVLRFVS